MLLTLGSLSAGRSAVTAARLGLSVSITADDILQSLAITWLLDLSQRTITFSPWA
jgi:hypothetical protein